MEFISLVFQFSHNFLYHSVIPTLIKIDIYLFAENLCDFLITLLVIFRHKNMVNMFYVYTSRTGRRVGRKR